MTVSVFMMVLYDEGSSFYLIGKSSVGGQAGGSHFRLLTIRRLIWAGWRLTQNVSVLQTFPPENWDFRVSNCSHDERHERWAVFVCLIAS